jgi:Domain of unknown function (DUF4281)
MSYDVLFLWANASVMPAWLLLALAPRWIWTRRLVHSMLYPALLGALYTVNAIGLFSRGGPEGGGFGTLAGVMTIFSDPQNVLTGWVHYLVFDLFVGAWEARDAARLGIPHIALLPCLFFTLMLGPLGLLLYLGIRLALRREAMLDERPS